MPNINNFSKIYSQYQQYLYLNITFSKNSSNIFLIYTKNLYLYIYKNINYLPLPYYISYQNKTNIKPQPYTKYISLFKTIHQTKRKLKHSQIQISNNSLKL